MDWTDILKVQVLGSKQKVKMGIKPLPKEEQEGCWERLKRAMEYIQGQAVYFQHAAFSLNKVPEEVACKAIEMFGAPAREPNEGEPPGIISGFRIWVGLYLNDNVELILSIWPINSPTSKSRVWLRYHTEYNLNLSDIDTAVEYNEKIFNIVKKFLNMIGQEPYYSSNWVNANYLNRKKRGEV